MKKGMVENLFPIPVHISDGYKLNLENKDALIKETIENQKLNQNGNLVSLNDNVLDIPYLSDLKKHLMKQINNYVYEVLCIPKSVDVYITQSWLNINRTDKSHHVHHHSNSFISGTYYLQGNTPITFKHDRAIFQNFDFEFTEINYFNTNLCNVTIQEGRCILFPSVLPHLVNPNKNTEERISLSFNTFIKGTLTTLDGQLAALSI
jgi:uncharacterized protein (TIGR02466 family)